MAGSEWGVRELPDTWETFALEVSREMAERIRHRPYGWAVEPDPMGAICYLLAVRLAEAATHPL